MSSACKLLVVEDDEDTADSLKSMLESFGYRTLTVSPARAESAAQQFEPDCVLLHLGHPNHPWLNLVEGIRSVYRDVPFVGVTGWTIETFAADADRIGLTALFQKPIVDIASLLRVLPPPNGPQRRSS